MIRTDIIIQLIKFTGLALPAAVILIQTMASLFGENEFDPDKTILDRGKQSRSSEDDKVIFLRFNKDQASLFGLKFAVIFLSFSFILFASALSVRIFANPIIPVTVATLVGVGMWMLVISFSFFVVPLILIRPAVWKGIWETIKWISARVVSIIIRKTDSDDTKFVDGNFKRVEEVGETERVQE